MARQSNTIFSIPIDENQKVTLVAFYLERRSQSVVAMDEVCQPRGKLTYYLGHIRARSACSVWANRI